jgi:hypothetical protein
MKNNSTGFIKPFNLDPDEYHAMFNASPPDSIMVCIYMIRMPTACPICAKRKYHNIHQKFLSILSTFPAAATNFGISAAVSIKHGFDDSSSCTRLLDIPWAHDWAIEGLYAQTGFFNPNLPGSTDPTVAILASMHNIDMHIAASDTTDPAHHKPHPADQELADEFGAVVEDVYRSQVGIWCQALVDFRIMMMIKMRELLRGRDPDEVYNRCVKAGGLSLVDYLQLCP